MSDIDAAILGLAVAFAVGIAPAVVLVVVGSAVMVARRLYRRCLREGKEGR